MCYYSRPSMVMWEIMNKKWTEYSSHSDYVRSFFNTFISQHPGFQFTVAQKFDALSVSPGRSTTKSKWSWRVGEGVFILPT